MPDTDLTPALERTAIAIEEDQLCYPDGPFRGQGLADRVEHDFRIFAFKVAYERMWANEPDLTIRFIRALTFSAQPVRDPNLEWGWKVQRAAELENLARGRKRDTDESPK